VAINPNANGTITVSIPTEVDSFYYLQTNPKLTLPLWDYDFGAFPAITGDGTVQGWEFTPTEPNGFLRVEVFSY
jgi:hypothetical protein